MSKELKLGLESQLKQLKASVQQAFGGETTNLLLISSQVLRMSDGLLAETSFSA